MKEKKGGNMWVKIEKGVGEPGKLWTGSELNNSGKYARVELIEFRSPESGACTRRLFFRETCDEAPEGVRIPTLNIFTGGVGSIVSGRIVREKNCATAKTKEERDSWLVPLLVWNWSGRVGGFIILDPVAIESGYVRREEVNSALPGYAWIKVYEGSTLSEYVLVRTNQVNQAERGVQPAIKSVDRRHVLPVHRVKSLLSPPERSPSKEPETPPTEEEGEGRSVVDLIKRPAN